MSLQCVVKSDFHVSLRVGLISSSEGSVGFPDAGFPLRTFLVQTNLEPYLSAMIGTIIALA